MAPPSKRQRALVEAAAANQAALVAAAATDTSLIRIYGASLLFRHSKG